MEIPIQNIYYLLSYAWDKLEEKEIVNVDATKFNNTYDFFARVLVNGINYIIKRGLDRSYIVIEEEIKGIKGKIDFKESINRNLFKHGKSFCEFDDFKHDILHNQIIKYTARRLSKVNGLDNKLKGELMDINRKLSHISDKRIIKADFKKIQLDNNNRFYSFLLNVCEIINDSILVTEETGEFLFKDFIKDEGKMWSVFEDFVRNFYKREQNKFSIGREWIYWDVKGPDTSLDLIPVMKPDITLTSELRKIILDAKYYKDALSRNYNGTDKLRSDHLYQLYAYIKNIVRKEGLDKDYEGVLLYPSVSYNLNHIFYIDNYKITIRTINLSQSWEDIRDDLLELIK